MAQMTLGEYRKLALVLSGDEESRAVKFFDNKVAEQGEDEPVVAPESQMMVLMGELLFGTETETV